MTSFDDLDLAGRHAWAIARLAPLAARLGGAVTTEDTNGATTVAAVAADDDPDGLFVVVRAPAPSGRSARILANVIDHPRSVGRFQRMVAGNVLLAVAVDNRLGELDLVQHLPGDDDAPDPTQHAHAAETLYVSAPAAADRTSMQARLARLPALVGLVDGFLRRYQGCSLQVLPRTVETSLAFLDDDDADWAASTADLRGRIDALDHIAGVIETVPIAGFATCRFCGGRFMPGPTARCPHCAAAL